MELSTFWRTLLRRWYLVGVAVLLTGGITMLAVDTTGPTYRAEGLVLLFPPSTTIQEGAEVETQGNPYLLLGGLTQARDIVIRTLTAKSAVDDFAARHPGVSYEAVPDFTSSSPIILITTNAPTATAAVAGLNGVIDEVPAKLVELQSGLNLEETAYITSATISADTRPDVVRKTQIRVGLAAGGATLAVCLLLIALADGLLVRRRSRIPTADAPSHEAPSRPAVAAAEPPPATRPRTPDQAKGRPTSPATSPAGSPARSSARSQPTSEHTAR
jgi:hypothetical protein